MQYLIQAAKNALPPYYLLPEKIQSSEIYYRYELRKFDNPSNNSGWEYRGFTVKTNSSILSSTRRLVKYFRNVHSDGDEIFFASERPQTGTADYSAWLLELQTRSNVITQTA